MRVLVTNDDGIESAGIHILARELLTVADVLVVAPEEENSGVGHAITLGRPLQFRNLDGDSGIPGYAVRGTPVDCVRLALDHLDEPFDLVVSGINAGANVGLNIHYSGTVAAALEAAFIGKMGLAVSIATSKPKNYLSAAVLAAGVARRMLEQNEPLVLNLNVPDLPMEEIRGIRVTRSSVTEKETILAIEGNCPENVDECGEGDFVLDSRALAAGFVSVTALQLDLTAGEDLKLIQQWDWRDCGGR